MTIWRSTLITAMFVLAAGAARASVDRVNTDKTAIIYDNTFKLIVSGNQKSYRRVYKVSAHEHVWEDGNCGAFSCNLTCTGEISNPSLHRELLLADAAGKYSLVSSKDLALSGDRQSYGKNCNDFMNANWPGMEGQVFGSYASHQGEIDSDYQDILKEIHGSP